MNVAGTRYAARLRRAVSVGLTGSVARLTGAGAVCAGLPAPVGAEVSFAPTAGPAVDGVVTGFHGGETFVMPFADLAGVRRGDRVRLVRGTGDLSVGEGLIGRVLDGRGRVIDGKPAPPRPDAADPNAAPPSALGRPPIRQKFDTGVRVIDGLLTVGRGQRIGLFAGSGVGKSTLLAQLARGADADVSVLVLVGERGREVREFLDHDLGPDGLQRSVVVVATGDEPAAVRLRAALTGTAIAEYFRDRGRSVLLMLDSVTRLAQAQREIGLAAGEPPATRGYPPSVFALLPRLLERSGPGGAGSGSPGCITAFYTTLVDGDDPNEPIADAVRGTLDGHVWLSRSLAESNHFPAVDVPGSLSRLMAQLAAPDHAAAAGRVRSLLASHREAEDLIRIGAYQAGSSQTVDAAVRMKPAIDAFLRQRPDESTPAADAVAALLALAAAADAGAAQ
ncbi:FliI/YscN family ATPase [Alienimonas chondri]|uniref:Flagellum-specific ATP synthase n=1 Tax=Alienimonas chondri TaxID=2681879 RepID=A0ABX1VI83_9PLAN|nr:FliI/YscN family ATPase [Alienimonas chondri]NNJ26993.1 Flagellum-specific ATP synthase [Alienimonas chondri]